MGLLPEAVAPNSLGHIAHTIQLHKKVNRIVECGPDFGAVGDGVTDDTAAVQAAIAAAGPGGTVVLPDGPTLVSAALQGEDGMVLTGYGRSRSILTVAPGHSGTHMLNLQGDTEAIVQDIGFDGQFHATCLTGLRTNTASTDKRLTVQRCFFTSLLPKTTATYGTTAGAMWLWSADGLDILYNEITDCGRGIIIDDPSSGRVNVTGNKIWNSAEDICNTGIFIKKATTFSASTKIVIENNDISGCKRDTTDVDPYTGNGQEGHGIAISRVRNVRIVNNACYNNGRGILASNESMGSQIQGNQCWSNTDSGIRLEPESATQDVTTGAADVRGLIVTGNHCFDNGSGFQHLGYYGKGIEVSYAAGSIVANNQCHDNMHAGINDDSASVIIIGNECYNNWKGTYTPSNTTKGGIRIAGGASVSGAVVLGNVCYDNQTVKTQEYGLTLTGSSSTGTIVANNNFGGNGVGEIDDVTKIKQGFFGTPPVSKPAVTGSKGGNAALASLMTALSSLGLVTDSTT